MSNETQDLYDMIYLWWYVMHDIKNEGKNPQRADLAKLRRLDLVEVDGMQSVDVTGALLISSFQDLYRKVAQIKGFGEDGKKRLNNDQTERLVIIASSLARVRENAKQKLGEYIGGIKDEERIVSEARFKRLLRAQTNADLFDAARRLCAIMDKTAPVKSLAKTLFEWGNDYTRRTLAIDYYHLNFTQSQQ